MDDTQRPSPLDVEGLAGGAHLWRDVEAALTPTTDALGEASKRFAIQGVGAAKVVDDGGGGAPLGRVPARLGELVVLHGGTVFVVAFGRLQIHAYPRGVLQSSVKSFFYSRVSMFGGRIGEAPLDFPCFAVLSWPTCALAPQTRGASTPLRAPRRPPPMTWWPSGARVATPTRGGPSQTAAYTGARAPLGWRGAVTPRWVGGAPQSPSTTGCAQGARCSTRG